VKRTFSREYELPIVKEILWGEQPVLRIRRDKNVGQYAVRRWKREYEESGMRSGKTRPRTANGRELLSHAEGGMVVSPGV
jgi:hypothetical protein